MPRVATLTFLTNFRGSKTFLLLIQLTEPTSLFLPKIEGLHLCLKGSSSAIPKDEKLQTFERIKISIMANLKQLEIFIENILKR